MPVAAIDNFLQTLEGKGLNDNKLNLFKEELKSAKKSFKKFFSISKLDTSVSVYFFEDSANAKSAVQFEGNMKSTFGESLISLIDTRITEIKKEEVPYARKKILIESFVNMISKYEKKVPIHEYIQSILEFSDSLAFDMGNYDLVDYLCYCRIERLIDREVEKSETTKALILKDKMVMKEFNSCFLSGSIVFNDMLRNSRSMEPLNDTSKEIMAEINIDQFKPYLIRISIKRLEHKILSMASDDKYLMKTDSTLFIEKIFTEFYPILRLLNNDEVLAKDFKHGLESFINLIDHCLRTGLFSLASNSIQAVLDLLFDNQTLEDKANYMFPLMARMCQVYMLIENVSGSTETLENYCTITNEFKDYLPSNQVSFWISFFEKLRIVLAIKAKDFKPMLDEAEAKLKVKDQEEGHEKRKISKLKKRQPKNHSLHDYEDIFKRFYSECQMFAILFGHFSHLDYFSLCVLTLEAINGKNAKGLDTLSVNTDNLSKIEIRCLALIQCAWDSLSSHLKKDSIIDHYRFKTENVIGLEDTEAITDLSHIIAEATLPSQDFLLLIKHLFYFREFNKCSLLCTFVLKKFDCKSGDHLKLNILNLLSKLETFKLNNQVPETYCILQNKISHENAESLSTENDAAHIQMINGLVADVASSLIKHDEAILEEPDLVIQCVQVIWNHYTKFAKDSINSSARKVSFEDELKLITVKTVYAIFKILMTFKVGNLQLIRDICLELVASFRNQKRYIEASHVLKLTIEYFEEYLMFLTANQLVEEDGNVEAEITRINFYRMEILSMWHNILSKSANRIDSATANARRKSLDVEDETLYKEIIVALEGSYASNDTLRALLYLDGIEKASSDHRDRLFKKAAAHLNAHISKLERHERLQDHQKAQISYPPLKFICNNVNSITFQFPELDDYPFQGRKPKWCKFHCKVYSSSGLPLHVKDSDYPGTGFLCSIVAGINYTIHGLKPNMYYVIGYSLYDTKGLALDPEMSQSSRPILVGFPLNIMSLWFRFHEIAVREDNQVYRNIAFKNLSKLALTQTIDDHQLLKICKSSVDLELKKWFSFHKDFVGVVGPWIKICFMEAIIESVSKYISQNEVFFNDEMGQRNVIDRVLDCYKNILKVRQAIELSESVENAGVFTRLIKLFYKLALPMIKLKNFENPTVFLIDSLVSVQRAIGKAFENSTTISETRNLFLPILKEYVFGTFWLTYSLFKLPDGRHLLQDIVTESITLLSKFSNEVSTEKSFRTDSINNLLDFSTRKTLTIVEKTKRTQYEEAVFHALKSTSEIKDLEKLSDIDSAHLLVEHFHRILYSPEFASLNENNPFVSSAKEVYEALKLLGHEEAYQRLSKLKVHPRFLEFSLRLVEESCNDTNPNSTIETCYAILDWLDDRNAATLDPYTVGKEGESSVPKKNTFFARKKRRLAVRKHKEYLQKAMKMRSSSTGSIRSEQSSRAGTPELYKAKSDNVAKKDSIAHSENTFILESRIASPSKEHGKTRSVEWATKTLRRHLPEIWMNKRFKLRLREMLVRENGLRARICYFMALSFFRQILSLIDSTKTTFKTNIVVFHWPLCDMNDCLVNLAATSVEEQSDQEKAIYGVLHELNSYIIQAAVLSSRSKSWAQLLEVCKLAHEMRAKFYELNVPFLENYKVYYMISKCLQEMLDLADLKYIDFTNRETFTIQKTEDEHTFAFLHSHRIIEGLSQNIVDIRFLTKFMCYTTASLYYNKKYFKCLDILEIVSPLASPYMLKSFDNIKDLVASKLTASPTMISMPSGILTFEIGSQFVQYQRIFTAYSMYHLDVLIDKFYKANNENVVVVRNYDVDSKSYSFDEIMVQMKRFIDSCHPQKEKGYIIDTYHAIGNLYLDKGDLKRAAVAWANAVNAAFESFDVIPHWKSLFVKTKENNVSNILESSRNLIHVSIILLKLAMHNYGTSIDKRIELSKFAVSLLNPFLCKCSNDPKDFKSFMEEQDLNMLCKGISLFHITCQPSQMLFYLEFLVHQLMQVQLFEECLPVSELLIYVAKSHIDSPDHLKRAFCLKSHILAKMGAINPALKYFESAINLVTLKSYAFGFMCQEPRRIVSDYDYCQSFDSETNEKALSVLMEILNQYDDIDILLAGYEILFRLMKCYLHEISSGSTSATNYRSQVEKITKFIEAKIATVLPNASLIEKLELQKTLYFCSKVSFDLKGCLSRLDSLNEILANENFKSQSKLSIISSFKSFVDYHSLSLMLKTNDFEGFDKRAMSMLRIYNEINAFPMKAKILFLLFKRGGMTNPGLLTYLKSINNMIEQNDYLKLSPMHLIQKLKIKAISYAYIQNGFLNQEGEELLKIVKSDVQYSILTFGVEKIAAAKLSTAYDPTGPIPICLRDYAFEKLVSSSDSIKIGQVEHLFANFVSGKAMFNETLVHSLVLSLADHAAESDASKALKFLFYASHLIQVIIPRKRKITPDMILEDRLFESKYLLEALISDTESPIKNIADYTADMIKNDICKLIANYRFKSQGCKCYKFHMIKFLEYENELGKLFPKNYLAPSSLDSILDELKVPQGNILLWQWVNSAKLYFYYKIVEDANPNNAKDCFFSLGLNLDALQKLRSYVYTKERNLDTDKMNLKIKKYLKFLLVEHAQLKQLNGDIEILNNFTSISHEEPLNMDLLKDLLSYRPLKNGILFDKSIPYTLTYIMHCISGLLKPVDDEIIEQEESEETVPELPIKKDQSQCLYEMKLTTLTVFIWILLFLGIYAKLETPDSKPVKRIVKQDEDPELKELLKSVKKKMDRAKQNYEMRAEEL